MYRLFLPILGIATLGLLVLAFYHGYEAVSFRVRAASAQGIVEAREEETYRQAPIPASRYRPAPIREREIKLVSLVVGFSDASGQKHTTRVPQGKKSLSVGDPVDILYLEGDPQKARLNSFIGLWRLPLLFGLCAMITGALWSILDSAESTKDLGE